MGVSNGVPLPSSEEHTQVIKREQQSVSFLNEYQVVLNPEFEEQSGSAHA
jgi:hypothetical protein